MGRSSSQRDELGLAGEVGVAADEVRGTVEDALVGAAVVREGQAAAAKTAADVLNLRVTPAVDRLLRVADHGDVAEVVGGEQADEVELDAVRVLELVDEQVAESLAALAAELGHTFERVGDLKDQVVEVTQPLLVQRVLVGAIHGVEDGDGLPFRERRIGTAGTVLPAPHPNPLPPTGGGNLQKLEVPRALPQAFGRESAAL